MLRYISVVTGYTRTKEGEGMLYISICSEKSLMAEKVEDIVSAEAKRQHIVCTIEQYVSGEDFLKQYQPREHALIFLDIDMQGRTGVDVAERMQMRHKNIILLTDSEQFILDFLSYCPFQMIRKADMERDIPIGLKKYLESHKQKMDILEFCSGEKIYHIKKQEVMYIEKWRNYVMIYMKEGKEWKMRSSIRQLELMLSGDGFMKVHAGCIINIDYCQAIEKGEAVMTDGARIPISRGRGKIVREQFMMSRRM